MVSRQFFIVVLLLSWLPLTILALSGHPHPTARGALPSDTANLSVLAAGAPLLLPQGFVPNQGIDAVPPLLATSLATELHLAAEVRLGLGLVLPLIEALAAAFKDGIRIHVSPTLFAKKLGKDLGRLCFDYTRGLLNDVERLSLLDALWGPIQLPQVVDFCRTWESARAVFPGEVVTGYALDFSRWYKRIRLKPSIAGLLATTFIIDGVVYLQDKYPDTPVISISSLTL
jgi:hypothetical protein